MESLVQLNQNIGLGIELGRRVTTLGLGASR